MRTHCHLYLLLWVLRHLTPLATSRPRLSTRKASMRKGVSTWVHGASSLWILHGEIKAWVKRASSPVNLAQQLKAWVTCGLSVQTICGSCTENNTFVAFGLSVDLARKTKACVKCASNPVNFARGDQTLTWCKPFPEYIYIYVPWILCVRAFFLNHCCKAISAICFFLDPCCQVLGRHVVFLGSLLRN